MGIKLQRQFMFTYRCEGYLFSVDLLINVRICGHAVSYTRLISPWEREGSYLVEVGTASS